MPDLCDTPTPSRLRRRKNCGRSAPTVRLLRLSRGELLSGLVRLGFTDAQTFRAGAGMWESLVQPLCVGADDTNAQRLGHAAPSPRSSAGQVTLRRAAICLAAIIIRLPRGRGAHGKRRSSRRDRGGRRRRRVGYGWEGRSRARPTARRRP